MREFTTAPAPALPSVGNLTDDVVGWARRAPDRTLFHRRGDGRRHDPDDPDDAGAGWREVSAERFAAEVVAVAKGLLASGVEAGDRVAIMGPTSYEWTVVDYAVWFAGGVSVPVYETSSPEQATWILADSGSVGVVAGGATELARLEQARAAPGGPRHVWSLADGALAELARIGSDLPDAVLEERRQVAGPGDPATLIYTSGTTGRPKGCLLTHGNLMAQARAAAGELPEVFSDDAVTLLFLPLAHVFARVTQLGCVHAGVAVGHSHHVSGLAADLASLRPTFLLVVPRVLERIYNAAAQRATADGRGGLFARATETAVLSSRGLDRGRRPALPVRAQHAVFDRLVYRRLREELGGRCRFVLSGGAPLGERLAHFFTGAGLQVLEGYGLTETSGALTANLPDAARIGTVGRPLPGTSVRVADDGELVFQGPQVFAGYWNDPASTAQAIDEEGWFHSGDLGEIDDAGFVRITGRAKEIIVTAGGKNVAPSVLEDRLRAHPLVAQCLVVGEGRPFIAALVTLDPDAFDHWLQAQGRRGDREQHVDDPELRAVVEQAVAAVNESVSQAESIRRFVILPGDWTEEGGQLTPSLKLRRNLVLNQCKDQIAALYLT